MERNQQYSASWGADTPVHAAHNAFGCSGTAQRAPQLSLAGLLDELSFGVAIVDAQCRVVHATRAARMQLQAGRGLKLVAEAVETEVAADGAGLHRAVEAAVAGRRSYLAFGRSANKLDIAILPLDMAGATPMVALVFEKCAGSGGLGLYFFAQAYRLTRAEQSVLTELCDGTSVIEAANHLGSSVHTARTHVRNILVKTAQPNLRGLIRRIGMLPPVGARFAVAHVRGEGLARETGAASIPATPSRGRRAAAGAEAVAECAVAA
jgi:hypothetical protein